MENSIPVKKLTFKEVKKELTPTLETHKKDDKILKELQEWKGWDILKAKIEIRIKAIEEGTKGNIEDIEDVELYGFKCLARDIIVEQLQEVINDVEKPAKYLRETNGDTK